MSKGVSAVARPWAQYVVEAMYTVGKIALSEPKLHFQWIAMALEDGRR